MRRAVAFLIALCCILSANAIEISHRIDQRVDVLTYHYRAKLKSSNSSKIGLRWNVTDSVNYRYATVSALGAAAEDAWGDHIMLTIGEMAEGRDSVIHSDYLPGTYDLHGLGLSMILDVGENGSLLEIGSLQVCTSIDIDFDCSAKGFIEAWSTKNAELKRDDLRATYLDEPNFANFATMEELSSYLAESTDPCEGFWTYFDRNTNPLRAQMGGKYTLATVSEGDNAYTIIYIGGAESHTEDWPTLRVKGRMTKATFEGTFDLLWYEPNGRKVDYETSATIVGDLLEMRFPHWKSTVRYRRIATPEPHD